MNENSYENVFLKWAPELRRFSPKAKIILAGTKTDLRRDTPSHIRTEKGEMLARDINANGFIENSSKAMSYVDATFQMAISAALFNKNFLKVKKQPQCTCL
ncbi:hypothetical protein JTB14_023082 [Gonioctena quinquepunctata]|nr:hypothetical protein JTB14_023082 [Gonioctena quinquepunctata]